MRSSTGGNGGGQSKPTNRWHHLVVVLGVALMVSACGQVVERVAEESLERAAESSGGGDIDIDVTEEGASVQADVEGEDFSVEVGSDVELPDGLVIPLADGGKVTLSGSQGGYIFVTAVYPLEAFDRLVDFYEDWTGGDAADWQHSESNFTSEEGTYRSVQWLAGASNISIGDCLTLATDEPDAVCVTINQSG